MSDPEPPRVPPYASFSLGPAVIDHHPFPSLGVPGQPDDQRKRGRRMTWDDKPEHRNLGGGDQLPKPLGDQLRDLSERLGWQRPPAPQPDPMPADPFDGLTAAAVAQVEMFHAMTAAGLTETQALYYVACLVQVGRAMDEGGMLAPMPDPPEEL